MPKVKTHSSSKKRFKKMKSGLIKRTKAFRRHHAWAKSAKSIRGLRAESFVHCSNAKNIAKLLPN